MMSRFFTIPATIILLLIMSCASIENDLPDWDKGVFFRNAQTAMESRQFRRALTLYDVYLVRYPEDISGRIAAQYEKAYILYKMGKLADAEKLYTSILEQYQSDPFAALYHPRYKTLSEVGIQRIKKDRFVNNRLFWRVREKKWAENNQTEPEEIN